MEDLDGLIWFVLEQSGKEPEDEKVREVRESVIRHYRGGTIEIPNYKTTLRNKDIFTEYQERIDAGGYHDTVLRDLAREHTLTVKYISNIVRECQMNPGLFGV